jgi:hypothetical protein
MSKQVTNIRTNHHPRDLVTWWDLPESARPDFDYIEGEDRCSPRLFCYRGDWYDLNQFFPLFDHPDLPWHGYQGDCYFSGTLVRYCDNFERVIVGSYLS